MGPVYLDPGAEGQIGQISEVVGEEAFFNAVHAKVKSISVGGGRNGVGAGLHLALSVLGNRGDELARGIGETLEFIYDELEVITLGQFRDAVFFFKSSGVGFACQGISRWGKKISSHFKGYCEYRQPTG